MSNRQEAEDLAAAMLVAQLAISMLLRGMVADRNPKQCLSDEQHRRLGNILVAFQRATGDLSDLAKDIGLSPPQYLGGRGDN